MLYGKQYSSGTGNVLTSTVGMKDWRWWNIMITSGPSVDGKLTTLYGVFYSWAPDICIY